MDKSAGRPKRSKFATRPTTVGMHFITYGVGSYELHDRFGTFMRTYKVGFPVEKEVHVPCRLS